MSSLLTQISVIVVGYAALVALVSLFAIVRWRARPPWLLQLVWMLEFLLVLQALAGAGSWAAGNTPDEVLAFVGYLVSSVCVLPIAVGSIDTDDEGAWSVGVVAVASIAIAVISVRLVQTG